MPRAPVNPVLLRWARERAGRTHEELRKRFAKLPEWEAGELQPTLKQVEMVATALHVPVGYLFMREPPVESIPIPDFRTIAGRPVAHPSPDLLDTIRMCQERQSWYRYHARVEGADECSFVGGATIATPPETAALQMREALGTTARSRPTWGDALRQYIRNAEAAGVLVMVSGIVASNTHRRLKPEEFRGFALSDRLAPLVFINGADTKSAQMFTLAHELAHLWLGATALSDCEAAPAPRIRREEAWCNATAAEFLVPLAELRSELDPSEDLADALKRLTRIFKVSTLVMLRRLLDAEWLQRAAFEAAWAAENARLRTLAARSGDGGSFYRTSAVRVGRRFARALVVSTVEGNTLYRDAFRMLGMRRTESFMRLGRELGVLP